MIRVLNAASVCGAVMLLGCGGQQQPADPPKQKPKTEGAIVAKADPAKETKRPAGLPDDHDHSGWWCPEHGVPEEECSMCSNDVFKKLKPAEICKNHPDRAKDQCFICNPDQRAKYAAVYRAKYDKDPPEPTANMPEKK